MPLQHIKISYRHLRRNKIYGLVNMLGLSVGFASVLLIALYMRYELSFDHFYKDSDSIYRIALNRVYPDRVRDFASSVITLAPTLRENYPEIKSITRMHRLFFMNEVNVQLEDEVFRESRYLFADSAFFNIFSHQFIQGNPADALNAPDKVVVTKSTALKYFGRLDVLNENLRTNLDTSDYLISGVIEDLPDNTHFGFDLIGSIDAVGYLRQAILDNSWINPWVYTYVKLDKGADPMAFEHKIAEAVDQLGSATISQQLGSDYAELGHQFNYFLQPLKDIHLRSKLTLEVEPNSNIIYIYLLGLIAAIILAISSINFINLAVARAPTRAREVGVRKVVGSTKGSLMIQFLTESAVICSISALIAVGLIWILIPHFNDLVDSALSLHPLLNPRILLAFLGFIIIISALSGLYPALVLARFKPVKILKGSFKKTDEGVRLRNGLMTVQFVISMVLITGSVLIHQQMNYFREKDLGFEKENIMVIRQANLLGHQYQSFKNELRAIPGVKAVGGANGLPGDFHGSGVFKTANRQISDVRANTTNVDDDFLQVLNFELVQGRFFEESYHDSLSILINEAAAVAMGLENPVGKKCWNAGTTTSDNQPVFTIVGVVKDYHFYSLHNEIGPMIIFNVPRRAITGSLAINIRDENVAQTIQAIGEKWLTFADQEMNFSFLDKDLQAQYESDQATSLLFDIFTYVAIVMCCIGLFALATFVAQQRRKEMSIRKVVGASMAHIVLSFAREFIRILVVAFLIGIPLAYFGMKKWLDNFAYHVPITGKTFVLAALLLILFVALTLNYQAVRLARINPADSLRTE